MHYIRTSPEQRDQMLGALHRAAKSFLRFTETNSYLFTAEGQSLAETAYYAARQALGTGLMPDKSDLLTAVQGLAGEVRWRPRKGLRRGSRLSLP